MIRDEIRSTRSRDISGRSPARPLTVGVTGTPHRRSDGCGAVPVPVTAVRGSRSSAESVRRIRPTTLDTRSYTLVGRTPVPDGRVEKSQLMARTRTESGLLDRGESKKAPAVGGSGVRLTRRAWVQSECGEHPSDHTTRRVRMVDSPWMLHTEPSMRKSQTRTLRPRRGRRAVDAIGWWWS